MATKDDRPGLLSKVAKFVRNPTKDWSELDNPDQSQESGYDKQALKAMIERKRQNDFVRKREFDQLRKLRNRDPATIANMARPSFFQSSIATDQDGRAVTLKKIDEIEAQMSKQWWKGKGEGTTRNTDLPSTRESRLTPESLQSGDSHGPSSSQFPTQAPNHAPHHFAPTEAVALEPSHRSDIQEPELDGVEELLPMTHSYEVAGTSLDDEKFTSSEMFALNADELGTDPELEEAAIRFANGDLAGSEKGLLAALRGPLVDPKTSLSWVSALLDLYRVSNNRSEFESALQEFRACYGRSVPVWTGPIASGLAGSAQASNGVMPGGEPIWESPAVLDLRVVENLRSALAANPSPWYLAWGRLENITPDAVTLLEALFASLCEEPVALCFSGPERLVQRLRSMTPSGDREVNKTVWQVRLNALRAMHMIDEFELAALDYCITFELAPPAWTDPRCRYVKADGAVAQAERSTVSGPALEGEVVGDATQLLSALGGARKGSVLEISCRNLVRVDFSAAGSILNWVTQCRAEGVQVQFSDVHRLVASFFHVIGIDEQARVVSRTV